MQSIEGYNLVQAGHPDNTKRGGVCIYYKESLFVRVISLSYINDAILFFTNFKILLNEISHHKPSLSIITSNYNARPSQWWFKEINTTEGSKLFSETSSNGFSQLINEPTHIQTNISSCIDLIFTDQPIISKFWSTYIFTPNLSSLNSIL